MQVNASPSDPSMETAAAAGAAKVAAGASSPLDPRLAPLLLFDHDDGATAAAGRPAGDDAGFSLYSIPRKQMLAARVDVMRDHHCWATPQGWVLMAAAPAGSPDTFLWDPFTASRIDLPPDTEGFLGGDNVHKRRCLLSCELDAFADRSCCPVDVLVVDLADAVLWHCRLGGGDGDGRRWARHEYEPAALGATLADVPSFMSRLTAVGGGRLLTELDHGVAMLDLSPEEPVFSVIPVDDDDDRATSPPYTFATTRLVGSRGDLFRLRFCHPDMHYRFVAAIGVSKLDLPARAWVKAEALGGRAFLVVAGQFGASLDPEGGGLRGDCIYYVLRGDKALHVYSMERRTTTLHDPSPCLLDHCSPKLLIMPTC